MICRTECGWRQIMLYFMPMENHPIKRNEFSVRNSNTCQDLSRQAFEFKCHENCRETANEMYSRNFMGEFLTTLYALNTLCIKC